MIFKKELQPFIIVALALAMGAYFFTRGSEEINSAHKNHQGVISDVLAVKFTYLSKNGNSSCSSEFNQSVAKGEIGGNIQGSCCSPMDFHRYVEQVEALKKYSNILEIPPDPYDIDASLAKELAAHYEDALTPEQQLAYDYAMENSHEKGPCCCKCWHWYVYGGLAKLLIQKYGFSGVQIVDVWDLSDGCGGSGNHAGH